MNLDNIKTFKLINYNNYRWFKLKNIIHLFNLLVVLCVCFRTGHRSHGGHSLVTPPVSLSFFSAFINIRNEV